MSTVDSLKLNTDEYYEALETCGKRYALMVCRRAEWDGWVIWDKLHKFIYKFLKAVRDREPLCKMNRWLGYIQGVLIERGLTDEETERNWTRPLFKHLDYSS